MQTLRMLMTIIFALTSETEATMQELSPINQLIQEVSNQRSTLEQLGQVIAQRLTASEQNRANASTTSAAMPRAPALPQDNGPSPMVNSTLITTGTPLSASEFDILSDEELVLPTRMQPSSPEPSTSHSRAAPANPTNVRNPPQAPAGSRVVNAIAGIGLPANNQALMPTTNALELWGDKRCTWGKKHANKTYRQIYEQDPGYNQWALDRPSLQGDISDYANYVTTRKHLEQTLRDATR